MIVGRLTTLVESSAKPDVVVLALPIALIEKLVNASGDEPAENSEDDGDTGDDTLNFRDLLKAKALHLEGANANRLARHLGRRGAYSP